MPYKVILIQSDPARTAVQKDKLLHRYYLFVESCEIQPSDSSTESSTERFAMNVDATYRASNVAKMIVL